MGAYEFVTTGSGESAEDAFLTAKEEAAWQYGRGGNTGTIAEKNDFVLLTRSLVLPDVAEEYANYLLDAGDERIRDKRGPAGAIPLEGGCAWLFVGNASS